MGVGGRLGEGKRPRERRRKKKYMVARSLAEENAMKDTWLAQGAATSVLDEDPGAGCVCMCGCMCVEGNPGTVLQEVCLGLGLSPGLDLPPALS